MKKNKCLSATVQILIYYYGKGKSFKSGYIWKLDKSNLTQPMCPIPFLDQIAN